MVSYYCTFSLWGKPLQLITACHAFFVQRATAEKKRGSKVLVKPKAYAI